MSSVKRFKIFKTTIVWVFRHRWEKDKDLTNHIVWEMRRRFKLGIWFERSKVVGPVKKGNNREERVKNTFNISNLVNEYMIGLDLVICKTWVTIKFKPILKL